MNVLGPAVHSLPGGKTLSCWSRWYNFDVSPQQVLNGNVDFVAICTYDLWGMAIPGGPGWDGNFAQYNGYSAYVSVGVPSDAHSNIANAVAITDMWIAGGFPKNKILVSTAGSSTFAGQVAQYVVDNDLGGAQVFGATGNQGSLIALNDIFDAVAPPPPPPPEEGNARIFSSPAGARIFIDGADLGVSTGAGGTFITGLTPGQHILRLELAGYYPAEGYFSVSAGATTDVSLTLTPLTEPPPPPPPPPGEIAIDPVLVLLVLVGGVGLYLMSKK
jgi:hypothetical protein